MEEVGKNQAWTKHDVFLPNDKRHYQLSHRATQWGRGKFNVGSPLPVGEFDLKWLVTDKWQAIISLSTQSVSLPERESMIMRPLLSNASLLEVCKPLLHLYQIFVCAALKTRVLQSCNEDLLSRLSYEFILKLRKSTGKCRMTGLVILCISRGCNYELSFAIRFLENGTKNFSFPPHTSLFRLFQERSIETQIENL